MKLKITETTDTSISFYLEEDGEILVAETLTMDELLRYTYLKGVIELQYLYEVRKTLGTK